MTDAAPCADKATMSTRQPSLRFHAGQRFAFAGLPDQEAYDVKTPGSGAIGWTMEVASIGPSGTLSLRMDPAEPHEASHIVPVPLSEAMLMVAQGYWTPVE